MNILLCLSSAFLLILSFPLTEFSFLIWIALIPFFLALDGRRGWAGFGIGYAVGLLFFGTTLFWFIHVTLAGAILLNAYLAVYFAVFGFCYCWFSKRSVAFKLFLYPSLWTALEYVRGHLLTGFGWVCLGQSQYKNLSMIQIADITGMLGVSFLIVMVNVLLKEWVVCWLKKIRESQREIIRLSFVVAAILFLTLGYGVLRPKQIHLSSGGRIAVVQGNIPQSQKWQRSRWPDIMQKYSILTRQTVSLKPDLIIWPETSFPGFIWEAPELFEDLKNVVGGIQIPLLLGIVTQVNEKYFNSAFLLSKEGEVVQEHNKLHLVPFGEYVPLRHVFPFLADLVPIGDFSSGERYTIFSVPGGDLKSSKSLSFPNALVGNPQQMHLGTGPDEAIIGPPTTKGSSRYEGTKTFGGDNLKRQKRLSFAVLICFEDTVPELSRKFTENGAEFLVNITNDAWFLDTPAPFMHLQAAAFRAVENRRSLIRAANTGVSCFIDPLGRISQPVQDDKKKMTFVDGFVAADVQLTQAKTFYTKFGDIFTYLCFGCILWGVGKQIKNKITIQREEDKVPGQNKKILVIDDDKGFLKMIRVSLINHGFDVLTADTGEKGIQLAQKKSPDLIVLDVLLPGIKGREVCVKLKKDKTTSSIPVMFLTAKDSPDDVKAEMEAGAVTHLTKPVDVKKLILEIKHILNL